MRPFQSESLDQIVPALLAAQNEMAELVGDKKVEVKNKAGQFLYDYTYSTLTSLQQSSAPALANNGLVVTQGMVPYEGPPNTFMPCLGSWRTMLLHSSGQFIAWEHPIAGAWDNPSDVAGAATSASRVAYKGMTARSEASEPPPAPARGRPAARPNGQAPPPAPRRSPPPARQDDIADLPEDDGPERGSAAWNRLHPEEAAREFVREQVAERFGTPGGSTPAPSRRPPPSNTPRGVTPADGPPCPCPNWERGKGGFYGWVNDNGLTAWFVALGKREDVGFPDRFKDWSREQEMWACNEYEIERMDAARAPQRNGAR